jgi:hypothetical protein
MVESVERTKTFAGRGPIACLSALVLAAASAIASACSDGFEGCEATLDCAGSSGAEGGQAGAGEGGSAGDLGASGGEASGGSTSQGGMAGDDSGGGGDSSTESCVPAECDDPPSDDCTDPSTLLDYENTGECVEGECAYESSTRHCAAGCTVDACDGDEWIALADLNVPGTRHRHSAVWTGSEMIIWGGSWSAPPSYLQDGGRFDPLRLDTDAWIPLTTNNAPTHRANHTAVWTGTEMIVWGGSTSSANGSLLSTGGRYSPTAGWTFTNNTGAPVARTSHTAVWTGSEMIVWGGFTTVPIASGGRYVAGDDEWIAPPTGNGEPSARHLHTAIWTGTEMIVWGGNGGSGGTPTPLGTGGRYDPTTNEWTAVSTTNAPAARFSHTAVWTGSEMIIWGGDGTSDGNNPVPLDSGGRYNPKTDTWTALPSQAPRRLHTAVWTGSEMIVWGGYADGNVEQGARYSPTDDEWTPLPTGSLAPLGRTNHSAVWTGSEMIVFGGAIGGPGTSTGGRYVR